MHSLTAPNKSFFWSTVFLRELYNRGVDHIVISPGSRSTPLVIAAAAHPGFAKPVVLDERSAAFTALGIGKATGRPAALICTSGTAVANYFPAVIESRHSGIPLLILSADRPPNLRNIGASQAIDQLKLFGTYPVFFHEAGEPTTEPDDLKRLKMAAGQAVSRAIRHRGPAHINFPFRKPLEPGPEFVTTVENENRENLDKGDPKPHVIRPSAQAGLSNDLAELLHQARRPLVAAGPMNPYEENEFITKTANVLNAPLLAETGLAGRTSGVVIHGFDGFLRNRDLRDTLSPDLVIRFGRSPVSKALSTFLGDLDITHIHVDSHDEWQDANYATTHRVETEGQHLELAPDEYSPDDTWLDSWKQAEAMFQTFKSGILSETGTLTDGHLFTHFSSRVPDNWNIFLSNSFPVRDYFLFSPSYHHPVYMNRGASGIDGILSTAIGATAATGKGGLLFIGDLAFLHDSNALLNAKLVQDFPLVVVIINNRGGNIFRMLPVAQNSDYFERYFETPQDVNFGKLVSSHGVPYHQIESLKSLESLVPDVLTDQPGLRIIECITDAAASMSLRKKLWTLES